MKLSWGKIFLILLGSAVVILTTKTWHFEELDFWLKDKIQTYSQKNLPMEIVTSQVEFQLLPPKATFGLTQLKPRGELKSHLEPFSLKRVSLRPSIFHLLIGRLHLAKIDVDGANFVTNYQIKKSEQDIKIEFEKILQQIPVTQLELTNVFVKANVTEQESLHKVQLGPLKATITNDINNLLVKLNITKINATYHNQEVLKNTFFETHFFLTEKNLVLSDFKIKEQDSFVVASGSTQHSISQKQIKAGKLNLRVFMKAKHIKDLLTTFQPPSVSDIVKNIEGSIKTDLRFDIKDLENFNVDTKTLLYSFQYENFKIGDIDVLGSYKNNQKIFSVEKIKIKNNGLRGELGPSDISVKDLTISGTPIRIDSFSLKSFLKYAIGKDIPANFDSKGTSNCQGTLDPFKIDCVGQLEGEKILVNPREDRPILNLKGSAKIKGQLTITAKDVSYRASIALPHSSGESDGVINFKTGFNINYNTPALDMTAIEKISGLDIGGSAKIRGTTSGNSEAATFDLSLDGKNMSLEKYKLGDLSHQLKYSRGTLSVQKIQGTSESSRYLGNLSIQLEKEMINGRIQFPFIDLAVTQEAIKQNLDIPVTLTGTGAAVIQIDGPLDPKKLSFKAKARLYNCKVDQQHIETADIDITSEMGQITINSAIFEEKNSVAQFSGTASLDRKQYDLSFSSQKMYLDDIIYTTKYSTPTRGLFSLQGNINGPFNRPNVDLKFSSQNFQLAGKKIAPLSGTVIVYSNKTVAEINGPNNLKFIFRDLHNLPEYHVEGTTKNFDVAPLFTSLLEIPHIDDFKISITSNFNLKVPRQNPEKINGYLFIPALEIDTEKNKISSSKDISLFFANGKINFSPFELFGTGGQIKVKSNATTHPLDLHVSGVFSLSFAHLLTPFLETIEGQTTVNVRIQKKESHLEFFGSAFVDNGYLKLPDIQHAVENLKVDLLFNQDRININSLKAKFASGQMLGDGSIRFVGPKNIPLDLNLHLDNVDLNIPPQVNTIGSADLKLQGQWLPFELSGKYRVIDGLISKELSGDENSRVSAHEVFLPPALRNEDTAPILLNLEIIPVSPLKIKNSLVDGKIQGQIKVTGAPKSPILGGQISLTKFSQIIFRDVTFRVRDSNIVLSNTNPPNPSIYILADARYKGYDIEMLVQGTAEKPKFSLTSQPALTQPEIISLLALGYTSNEQNTNNPNNPAGNTTGADDQALSVGTGVFGQNPLGKEFKNRFGVDVQFSSRFDSSSSVAVPTIGFSKRLSERTSFVGSVQTGKDSRADGKLRYELDRGFAGTMSVQSQAREETNQIRGDNISDILGIDLEFRKEFK